MPVTTDLEDIRRKINELPVLAPEQVHPTSYQEIQQLATSYEVNLQAAKLRDIFMAEDATLEGMKADFHTLCIERDKHNQSSCLGYNAAPMSVCNAVFWEIALILFKPRNLGEMLAILMPSILNVVSFDLTLNEKAKQSQRVSSVAAMQFDIKPITSLDDVPADLTLLQHYAFGNHAMIAMKEINKLAFNLHEKLYALLDKFPYLKHTVYSFNQEFVHLRSLIEVAANAALKQRIDTTIKIFMRSGATATGEMFAREEATIAAIQFIDYIESFPEQDKKEMLAMRDKNGRYSLQSVIDHLRKLNCTDTAAKALKEIKDNPENAQIVSKILNFDKKDFAKETALYHKIALKTVGHDDTKLIPVYLRQHTFSLMRISRKELFIDLLLSLPASEIEMLLTYATIEKNIIYSSYIAENIGLLGQEKEEAYFNAILNLSDQFTVSINELFQFFYHSNSLRFFIAHLQNLPEDVRINQLSTLLASTKSGHANERLQTLRILTEHGLQLNNMVDPEGVLLKLFEIWQHEKRRSLTNSEFQIIEILIKALPDPHSLANNHDVINGLLLHRSEEYTLSILQMINDDISERVKQADLFVNLAPNPKLFMQFAAFLPSMNHRFADHSTLLGIALQHGSNALVPLLLEKGADPNQAVDEKGTTPITYLLANQSLAPGKKVVALLENGLDWHMVGDKHQALLFIIAAGSTNAFKKIPQEDLVSLTNIDDLLESMLVTGDAEWIRLLVARGAKSTRKAEDLYSLLYSAVKHANLDLAKCLIESFAIDISEHTKIDAALRKEKPLLGHTLIQRNLDMSRYLLEQNVDPNQTFENRYYKLITPLRAAFDLYQSGFKNYFNIMTSLIDAGANVATIDQDIGLYIAIMRAEQSQKKQLLHNFKDYANLGHDQIVKIWQLVAQDATLHPLPDAFYSELINSKNMSRFSDWYDPNITATAKEGLFQYISKWPSHLISVFTYQNRTLCDRDNGLLILINDRDRFTTFLMPLSPGGRFRYFQIFQQKIPGMIKNAHDLDSLISIVESSPDIKKIILNQLIDLQFNNLPLVVACSLYLIYSYENLKTVTNGYETLIKLVDLIMLKFTVHSKTPEDFYNIFKEFLECNLNDPAAHQAILLNYHILGVFLLKLETGNSSLPLIKSMYEFFSKQQDLPRHDSLIFPYNFVDESIPDHKTKLLQNIEAFFQRFETQYHALWQRQEFTFFRRHEMNELKKIPWPMQKFSTLLKEIIEHPNGMCAKAWHAMTQAPQPSARPQLQR